jgi:hypothetical protein
MIYKVTIDNQEALVDAKSPQQARTAGIDAYIGRVVIEKAEKADIDWANQMGGGNIIRAF